MRIALRRLIKSPAFSVVALITLALGIGVNTSMYTLLDTLLLRSLPFPEGDRLLSVVGTTPQSQRDGFSFAELEEMRAQAAGPGKAFESLTAFAEWDNTLAEPGATTERLFAIDATADFFTTFRVQPMLGRAFTADEEVPGRNRVAILSYHTWQARFGGDRNVIGRSLRLDAEQVTIIGVMPESFAAPLFFGPVDLWRPITVPRFIVDDRSHRFFNCIARLNPGVTPEQASAQLAPLAARWAADYPATSKDRGFSVLPPQKVAMDSTSTFITWLLFGLGAAVLLVACANIANLQLARATANMKDLAIRSSLGASRARLIVHQLTESMTLAMAGGACGVLVALWVNALLSHAIRIGTAENTLALPMNARVLLGAFGASLLSGLLFGLLPAWFASRGDMINVLKQQSRGATTSRGPQLMRHALVVGQVAVALALLGVASVMIRGFDALLKKEAGWDTDHVLLANIHLPEQSRYQTDDSRRVAIDKLARRLAEIPGAGHTAVCSNAPLFFYSKVVPIQVEGVTSDDPTKQPIAGYTMVGDGYFAALGISLREGEDFSPDIKADDPPVVIINETMARHFWPNQSAIGKRIADRQNDQVVWRRVVGVVNDIQFPLNVANLPTMFQVYKPLVNEPWGYLYLIVRGPVPASFKNEVRRAVSDVDSDVAVQELFTVPEAADRYNHNLVVINGTLAGFAMLGLVLAAVGLYGVISYLVAQRTSEFGIRLALGATPRNVLRLVLRHGLALTAIGLVVGSAGAFALTRLVSAAMPRMTGSDPLALFATAATLFVVALFACWLPARRATRVDPLTALRTE